MSKTVDSREFYELMQAYRTTSPASPADVVAAYEAVKDWVRANYGPEANAGCVGTCQFLAGDRTEPCRECM